MNDGSCIVKCHHENGLLKYFVRNYKHVCSERGNVTREIKTNPELQVMKTTRLKFTVFVANVHKNDTNLKPLTKIGGFHVTSSPPCWWTVKKRSLISSLCLSTSICSFHHCYLCLPKLHENHLLCIIHLSLCAKEMNILLWQLLTPGYFKFCKSLIPVIYMF